MVGILFCRTPRHLCLLPKEYFDSSDARREDDQNASGARFRLRVPHKGGQRQSWGMGRHPEAYAFLRVFLTTEKLKELLRDISGFEMETVRISNLLAVNFYIKGVLGEGWRLDAPSDPQAKTLGE